MALPVLALPVIYTGIVSFLAAGFRFLINRLGFKVLLWVAVNAGYLASWAIAVAAIIALLDGLSVSVPTVVIQVWGWFMPSNTGACLSAIIAARVLMTIHEFRISMLEVKSRVFS